MKTVIQRVKRASVEIDGRIHGSIERGYMILVGISDTDDAAIVEKMAQKIAKLRIFEDENGKMNLNLEQINGKILSISQFTLYAEHAEQMYLYFNACMRNEGYIVEEGIFGADMQVELLNDGPVTMILDSDEIIKR